MRTPPEHDRALLRADTAALRDCAARLDALTGEGLPAAGGPDWDGVLAALAERCRVAAAELDRAAAAFFATPAESDGVGESGEADGAGETRAGAGRAGSADAGDSAARARALGLALSIAGRLLAAPRAAAEPLAPLIRRIPGGR
jgi:hypothetical protein